MLLYNFSLEDITIEKDKMGDNYKIYTLKAGEVKEFDEAIGQRLAETLAKREMWRNPPANHNRRAKIKELLEIIIV